MNALKHSKENFFHQTNISAGDGIAQEVKYHPNCLVALYNREWAYLKERKEDKAQG